MSHLETEFPRPKAEEYHIQLHPGDMPKGVLLPGSPQRVDLVLDVLEEGACLKYNREFRSARGDIRVLKLAVSPLASVLPVQKSVSTSCATLGWKPPSASALPAPSAPALPRET